MLLIAVAAPLVPVAAAVLTWRRIQRRWSGGEPRPAEAIVVFGAEARNGTPSPELQARLDRAAELYAAGYAPVVLCSGDASEAPSMRDSLVRLGVPAESIEVDREGISTRRTITAARRYRRVLAVSSPYHLHRILREARRQGVEASPVSARTWPARARKRLHQGLREVAAVWWYALSARTRRG
jgi:vancomycin permeability regulator SanA